MKSYISLQSFSFHDTLSRAMPKKSTPESHNIYLGNQETFFLLLSLYFPPQIEKHGDKNQKLAYWNFYPSVKKKAKDLKLKVFKVEKR